MIYNKNSTEKFIKKHENDRTIRVWKYYRYNLKFCYFESVVCGQRIRRARTVISTRSVNCQQPGSDRKDWPCCYNSVDKTGTEINRGIHVFVECPNWAKAEALGALRLNMKTVDNPQFINVCIQVSANMRDLVGISNKTDNEAVFTKIYITKKAFADAKRQAKSMLQEAQKSVAKGE